MIAVFDDAEADCNVKDRLFLAAEVSPEVARSASNGPSKSGMAYRGGGLAESLTDLELTR
jgi:hypothetical protein